MGDHGLKRLWWWLRCSLLRVAAVALIAGGVAAVAVAVMSQYHAPSPSASAAGSTGPAAGGAQPPTSVRASGPKSTPTTVGERAHRGPLVVGPILDRSVPVAIAIPTIDVHSSLQSLGLNPDGSIAVPQPGPDYNEPAWYQYSPTPGQLGPSVIEGHIDSAAAGPSVFFNLGALKPGEQVDVTRADGSVAVFTISGVRQYPKDAFPTMTVYGNTDFAALRLITCGGSFDHATGHYLNNTVVFASLSASHSAS